MPSIAEAFCLIDPRRFSTLPDQTSTFLMVCAAPSGSSAASLISIRPVE